MEPKAIATSRAYARASVSISFGRRRRSSGCVAVVGIFFVVGVIWGTGRVLLGYSFLPSSSSARPTTQVLLGRPVQLIGATGTHFQVTLTQLVDPVDPAALPAQIPGQHLVAAEFTITNEGTAPYSPDPEVDVQAEDNDGRPVGILVAPGPSVAGGVLLDTSMRIPPGQTATGRVLFEIPDGVKAARVRFATDGVGVSAGMAGVWTVR